MPQDEVVPTNTVLVAGEPVIEEFEVGANATAAKMLPGTCVIFDTVAGNIKEGGDKADDVLGVLMEKPNGLLTDYYDRGTMARVITGGKGVKVAVREVASGGASNPGTQFVCDTDGLIKIKAVGAQGAQGMTVGTGVRIVADPQAEERVIITLKLQPEALATS